MMINRILLICLVAMLCSCVGQKGAMKYYLKHNDQLAELCSAKFPVVNRAAAGVPVYNRDTVFLPGASIPCPEVTNPKTGEKSTPFVKCPDTEKIYINKEVTDTVYREDTAKIFALQSKYDKQLGDLQSKYQIELTKNSELQGDYNSLKKKKESIGKKLNEHQWISRILAVLLVGCVIMLFKK